MVQDDRELGEVRHRVLRADRGAGRGRPRASPRPTGRRPSSPRSTRGRSPRTSRAPATCSPSAPVDGGVLLRAGQTEAAVDLARLRGLYPAGVICEVMNEDGTMARVPQLEVFCARARHPHDHDPRPHPVPDAERAARAQDRRGEPPDLVRAASASTPSRASIDGQQHVALVHGRGPDGRPRAGARPLAVPDRRHLRVAAAATAASQLDTALERIVGRGPRASCSTSGRRAGASASSTRSGLRAAGPGPGHGRGQRGPRLQGGPARLRDRRADPRRARRLEAPADDQQPPEVRGPRGLRAHHHRAGPDRDRPPRTTAAATSAPRRRSWATCCGRCSRRSRGSAGRAPRSQNARRSRRRCGRFLALDPPCPRGVPGPPSRSGRTARNRRAGGRMEPGV